MSKSESICRVAFHHSEAIRVNAVFGTARSFGKSPVLKMFYSDTVVLLRFLPRMSLVSAVILGGQTHEQSHQIRDHLQPILEGTTCFALLRKYRLNTSVAGLKCVRPLPILAAQPSCLCRPEIFCPFRTQTLFPEPCARYECVYSG